MPCSGITFASASACAFDMWPPGTSEVLRSSSALPTRWRCHAYSARAAPMTSKITNGIAVLPRPASRNRRATRGAQADAHPTNSVLVDMLPDDHLQHSLIAQSSFGGLLAQLVDQVLLEHDRGRQGLADRAQPTSRSDVLSEIPLLELLDLEVAPIGLVPNHLRALPSPRHRFSFRCAAWAGS